MQFDWKSDEDGEWEADSAPKSAAPRGRARYFFLLLLLSAVAFFVWREVERRMANELSSLEADVRSAHEVAVRAVARGDQELFTSLLSGRNPEWTAAQQALLQEHLLFAGAGRSLGLRPIPAASAVTGVEFSPDLREAQLTVRHSYVLSQDGQAGETFHLQQRLLYRQGARGWLLSPPDETFWGEGATAARRHVTLRYRQREEEVAYALLSFLDDTLDGICTRWQAPCPPASDVQVVLDPGAQSLRSARQVPVTAGELHLPAPTLIGWPSDAVAARALFRAYAAPVVAATNSAVLDYDCCRQQLFFEALQRQQLYELGLRERPLAASDYVPFVDRIISLPRLNELWWWPQRQPPTETERRQIDAFVAFLLQEASINARGLQKGVMDAYGFWAWLRGYTPYDPAIEQAQLTAAWHNFVVARANEASDERERPDGPAQALWLTCQDDNGQRGLYRYEPDSGRMAEETGLVHPFESLVPAPGDDGLILFDSVTGNPSRYPARLRVAGSEIPLSGKLAPAYSLPRDPQGRYLTVWRVSQSGRTVDGAGLLDTTACQTSPGCPLHTAPGLPYWSPDGEQVLFLDTTAGELFLGDRDALAAEESIAQGASAPFWLDEEMYGYVADGGRRLLLSHAGEQARQILSVTDVLPLLDIRGQMRNWHFVSIYAAGTGRLVGAVTLPQSSSYHFFLLEGVRDAQPRPENLLYVPHAVIAAPDSTVSPDGRWLTLHLPAESFDMRFIMHDLLQNETTLDLRGASFNAFHAHDWSSDGRWLARLGNGYVELLSPPAEQDRELFRHFVPTMGMQCSSLAWAND